MPQMGLRYEISEDRDSLVITLLKEDAPLGHIVFDAPTLDEFLSGLSAYRKLMAGKAPSDRQASAGAAPVAMSAWAVVSDPQGPERTTVLTLRHPTHGKLSFALEPDQACAIARTILERLEEAETETPDRKYHH